MAYTEFTAADPLTRQQWADEGIFTWALQAMELSNLLGASSDSIIQVRKDLTKLKGDKVTFKRRNRLRGTGIGNQGRLRGNAEAMQFLNFTPTVAVRGNSVESDGPMSEQRAGINFRKEAKDALRDWLRESLDEDLTLALSGLYNHSGIETVNEAAPSANRIHYGGEDATGAVSTATMTTDALLSAETAASTLFGPNTLSSVKRKALLSDPPFRPIKIDGMDLFVCLAHPYQIKALRANSKWSDAASNAWLRSKKNPIFSGFDYYWDGVLIKEYSRIQIRTGAGGTTPAEGFTLNAGRTATTDAVASGKTVARGLFLGAQAGVLAWAQKPSWYEYWVDVDGRIPGVGTDCIYAAAKTQFNDSAGSAQEDFACYAIDTQVVPD